MPSLAAKDHGLSLHTEDDVMGLIGSGLPGCIFTVEDLHPRFFDLRNGIAGALLQKLVNYHFPVAIILPEDHGFGPRVTELVRDHRRHPVIRFFTDAQAGQDWLDK